MLRSTLAFFTFFSCFLLLLWGTRCPVQQDQVAILHVQAGLLRDEMSERLSLYFRQLETANLLMRKIWQHGQPSPPQARAYLDFLHQSFPEAMTMNLLDPQGRITMTSPSSVENLLLNRVSSYKSVLSERLKDRSVVFGQPINLYEGGTGFGVYVPLFNHDTHVGWIGMLFRIHDFFDRFFSDRLLREYNVAVVDRSEKSVYYRSDQVQGSQALTFPEDVTLASITGLHRELELAIWPIHSPDRQTSNQWPLMAIVSLILAALAHWAWLMFSRQDQANHGLRRMNLLLRSLAQDARFALAPADGTDRAPAGSPRERTLKAIDAALESFPTGVEFAAGNRGLNGSTQQDCFLGPLIDDLRPLCAAEMEHHSVTLDPTGPRIEKSVIHVHRALFTQHGLRPLLRYAILRSLKGGHILMDVGTASERTQSVVVLFSERSEPKESPAESELLLTARAVLRMHQGDLEIERKEGSTRLIAIVPRDPPVS